MKTKLVNLTPHELSIYCADGDVVTVPRTGKVARVHEVREPVGIVDGITIETVYPGRVEGIPPPQEGVVYIVSSIVSQATGRPDVFAPGQLIRDEHGQPLGCRGLCRREAP